MKIQHSATLVQMITNITRISIMSLTIALLVSGANAGECGYRETAPDCMMPPVFCAQSSQAIECNVGTRYHIHCSDTYENVDAYPQMKCVAAENTLKRCVEMNNYVCGYVTRGSCSQETIGQCTAGYDLEIGGELAILLGFTGTVTIPQSETFSYNTGCENLQGEFPEPVYGGTWAFEYDDINCCE